MILENWDAILDLKLGKINYEVEMLVGIKSYELDYKFEVKF